MTRDAKSVDDLSGDDLEQHPVWAFVNDDSDEVLVRPVRKIPVRDMAGKLVAPAASLANGNRVRALLGNMDLSNPRSTRHFLTLSVERKGKWFHLARYHDRDRDVRGPKALARFLGLRTSDVFPISYDVGALAEGDREVLCGTIPEEPLEKLTRDELIALAVL